MVTLHDTRFVECRWWNDGRTVKTYMIPAPGFHPRFRREAFPRSSHTGDLNIGAPLAVLLRAWRDKITGGTG